MFDIRIVNLDLGSYLRMTPKEALAKAKNKKKELYLQAWLEHRRTFTPMLYSGDGISGAKALASYKKVAALPSFKTKRGYYELCIFLRARMSLTMVISNSLILCGPLDKEAYIRQQPDILGGVVMALLASRRG